jgi:hypothetical protein
MKIRTVRALEELGRVRLSRSFFMRDFLHGEIANFYGRPNIPDDPDLAIHVGKRLCEELLETLAATFGRIAIRSAYRSPTVNARGSEKGHNCSSNEKNYASHIWDKRDAAGFCGATAWPAGYLLRGNEPAMAHPERYPDFPPLIVRAG